MQHYPSWRYHRNGKAILIPDPDHEPQGPDWAESPWPAPPPEPPLNDCCRVWTERFDAAWKKLKQEHAQEIAEADILWKEKVAECAALQTQLDALKASPEPAAESQPKSKKK